MPLGDLAGVAPATAEPERRSVLVIDDAQRMVEAMRTALEGKVPVFTAGGGREALAIYERERPIVVVIDLVMPDMDGVETVTAMKALDLTGTRWIALSLRGDDGSADLARRNGFHAVVYKPLQANELLAAVQAGVPTAAGEEEASGLEWVDGCPVLVVPDPDAAAFSRFARDLTRTVLATLGLAPSPVPVEGAVHPDFVAVVDALRWQLAAYPGGAAVCVYHQGECVADLWGGDRDGAGRSWTRDTMAPSFSTTKGVASTLVHVLADRGLVDYDTPVAAYWPEFAQAGKHPITVRHVLAHQSGLYHIRQMVDRAERMLDWDHMIHAIERATPLHPPGMRTGYHGLTYGFLVGELVQRVTGKRFPDLVQELISVPLGLDGMYVGCPAAELGRAAKLIWSRRGIYRLLETGLVRIGGREIGDLVDGPARLVQQVLDRVGVGFDLPSILDALAPRGIAAFDFGSTTTLQAAIPAANGLFTARALARMYAALACGGTLDGVRLLSPETLARATEVQAAAPARVVIPFDMRWRLGYHGVVTSRGVPRRAFGHFGFGGSGGWADPRRQLAVALIVNSGMGTPFGDLRIARIGGAALVGVSRRSAPAAASSPTRRSDGVEVAPGP